MGSLLLLLRGHRRVRGIRPYLRGGCVHSALRHSSAKDRLVFQYVKRRFLILNFTMLLGRSLSVWTARGAGRSTVSNFLVGAFFVLCLDLAMFFGIHAWEGCMRLAKMATFFPLLFLFADGTRAQTASGEVNGTVTDKSGGFVAGAAIRLTNQATKIADRVTTNSDGYFLFINVKPGTYVLGVEAKGFKSTQISSLDGGVNQTATQAVRLEVGAITERVVVNAEAAMLEGSTSDLGTVIEEKAVNDLPLNGRNFTQLLTLTPGVTPVSTAQNKSIGCCEGNVGIPGSGFSDASFHGQENRSKLYFFDGIINTNIRGPNYIVIPNIDAIQEFKVVGHDAKAEYGGATGGVVNMVSKSGGNDLHGSAFEFVRNDAFDARSSFDVCTTARCPAGQTVPKKPLPFRQNQFGGFVSGKIFKNRTFFSGGYDGWRYSQASLGLAYVPTAAEVNGDFTNTPFRRQIYNPYSTRQVGANVVRDAFRCDASGNPLPVNA